MKKRLKLYIITEMSTCGCSQKTPKILNIRIILFLLQFTSLFLSILFHLVGAFIELDFNTMILKLLKWFPMYTYVV